MAGIFTTLLGRAYYNKPLNFQKLVERPENEPPYEYLFTQEPELLAEREKHSKYASELLWRQASRLLIEASEQLMQEVIFRALRELHDQGHYKINSKFSDLLKSLTNNIIERVKLRVNAPSQGGSKATWTPERQEAFLVVYEDAYKTLKDAKDIYKQNKRRKWKELIRVEHPQLPDKLIKQLAAEKNSAPHILAYKYAASLFNVKCNQYLPKMVKAARDHRREKG